MQDTLTYIIVFGIGIVLISLYFYRNDKQHLLPVSKQSYADLKMIVSIKKEKAKLVSIVLTLLPLKTDVFCSGMGIELIDAQRKLNYLSLDNLLKQPFSELSWQVNRTIKIIIDAKELQELIQQEPFPFQSFRFVAETKTGKKFKSHELNFNERWNLFKVDSGSYN